ncbi:Pyrin [Oryzias melastigma]|uniref:Pyrin n=1 Tax=Oryzias melastigma TaxID=30732 RepID=A0A834F049_ORYME|nr:Pyrin [Oryzias melastigma]
MAVQRRILKALEDLDTDNFKKFQWQLQLGVSSYEPIPKSHLEHASRIQTVTKIVEKYGEDKAEEITIQTLKEIDNNDLAEKLKKACSGDQKFPI